MSDPVTADFADPQPRRLEYHRQLDALRSEVADLGTTVCAMIPKAASVLLDSDLQAAAELMELDDRITGIALDLEARMYDLIARQAPTASELRTLFVETKLVAAFERSSELTVHIARSARRLYEAPVTPGVRRVVAEMVTETQRLLELALRSFVEADADLARSIDELDDRVDQLNRDMIASIFDDMAGQPDLTSAVQMALVARYLERIGDHAVNVGNRVVYMVTGAHPPRRAAAPSETAD